MVFEDWWTDYTEKAMWSENDKILARKAWDAAKTECMKIAWEHGRDIRKPIFVGTRCDDIQYDIEKEL